MTAKLRIRTKGVEIEWEGEVDFLKSELPSLVGAIIGAIDDVGFTQNTPDLEQSISGNGAPKTFTTASLSAKIVPKNGVDLLKVSLAKLQLSDGLSEGAYSQILAEMKTAKQFYKQSMQNNLQRTLNGLMSRGEINQPSTDNYTLSHEVLEQFREKAK
jgi:hypothetical protein